MRRLCGQRPALRLGRAGLPLRSPVCSPSCVPLPGPGPSWRCSAASRPCPSAHCSTGRLDGLCVSVCRSAPGKMAGSASVQGGQKNRAAWAADSVARKWPTVAHTVQQAAKTAAMCQTCDRLQHSTLHEYTDKRVQSRQQMQDCR